MKPSTATTDRNVPLDVHAIVCRGGACKADDFLRGSGVESEADGTLSGVSTQSKSHATLDELAKAIFNNRLGRTTVAAITLAGGTIIADGHAGNPHHATVNGLSAAKLEALFTPTVRHPLPFDHRGKPSPPSLP